MAFAIIKTGGKQYRVSKGDKIEVEKLDGDVGASVTLGQKVTREGRTLFEAEVVLVLVSVSGKPLGLSDAVRTAFEKTGKAP